MRRPGGLARGPWESTEGIRVLQYGRKFFFERWLSSSGNLIVSWVVWFVRGDRAEATFLDVREMILPGID